MDTHNYRHVISRKGMYDDPRSGSCHYKSDNMATKKECDDTGGAAYLGRQSMACHIPIRPTQQRAALSTVPNHGHSLQATPQARSTSVQQILTLLTGGLFTSEYSSSLDGVEMCTSFSIYFSWGSVFLNGCNADRDHQQRRYYIELYRQQSCYYRELRHKISLHVLKIKRADLHPTKPSFYITHQFKKNEAFS